MTSHIMLDLETWGTAPGCDIRSIGACLFDPENGAVNLRDGDFHPSHFHIACENPTGPMIDHAPGYSGFWDGVDMYRKYPLTRDPQTAQWWNDQSDEAKASFVNPVDLYKALWEFGAWLCKLTATPWYEIRNEDFKPSADIRLWSHGPSFDPPILAAAYAACGLPVPWHYRAPRDTRTALELAGMDPHKGLEPFSTGTHHNALDDAICQARAVCEAYRRLHSPVATSLIDEYDKTFVGGMSSGLRPSIERFARWLGGRGC